MQPTMHWVETTTGGGLGGATLLGERLGLVWGGWGREGGGGVVGLWGVVGGGWGGWFWWWGGGVFEFFVVGVLFLDFLLSFLLDSNWGTMMGS